MIAVRNVSLDLVLLRDFLSSALSVSAGNESCNFSQSVRRQDEAGGVGAGLKPASANRSTMSKAILAVVDDLIFLAKIRQTARPLRVEVEPVEPREVSARVAAQPPGGVLVDLNHRSGTALEAVRALKSNAATARVPVVGFFSHVQTELGQAAREAGCDQVLPRSAFTRRLPELLVQLAGGEPDISR